MQYELKNVLPLPDPSNSVILLRMDANCVVHYLGRIPYVEAWQLQDRLAREIAAGARSPILLLLEHPHTYTFGRSGHPRNLLWDAAELKRREISVHWVDRGGDVTYHGPGQLVGYPLIPLGRPDMQIDPQSDAARLPKTDYIGYLRRLEEVLILALSRFGIKGQRLPGLTGVWVSPQAFPTEAEGVSQQNRAPAKIAAIGVKVDARGVTRHGFALNVNPDMTYWEGIIGCGLEDFAVTSMNELLSASPPLEKVAEIVAWAFGEVFVYHMLASDVIPAAFDTGTK